MPVSRCGNEGDECVRYGLLPVIQNLNLYRAALPAEYHINGVGIHAADESIVINTLAALMNIDDATVGRILCNGISCIGNL